MFHITTLQLHCAFSLALPDPLRTDAYRLEIISAALRGSGTIHRPKMNKDPQVLLAVDWNPFKKF